MHYWQQMKMEIMQFCLLQDVKEAVFEIGDKKKIIAVSSIHSLF